MTRDTGVTLNHVKVHLPDLAPRVLISLAIYDRVPEDVLEVILLDAEECRDLAGALLSAAELAECGGTIN